MANVGYKAQSAAVTLSASATKSVVGVKAHANSGIQVIEWGASFTGSAAATGIQVQLCYATFATNSPGTNSTSISTIPQQYGRVLAAGFTAAYNWTTEPTVLTVLETEVIQQSGAFKWAIPLGKEPDCALGEGFVVRIITPAAVTPDCQAHIGVERI